MTSVESDDQTLALYSFDARQGDVLKDASGQGHDGKIIGATWVHPASGRREPVESPAPSPTPADTEGLHPPLANTGPVQPADPPTPKQAPDPVVLQAARTNLAEKELYRDQAKQSHIEGQVTALDVIYKEIDVCEASIHLTQTEGNAVAILAAFMNLVSFREQEHAIIAQQVKAGQLPEDDVLRADASLYDAKDRLDQAVVSKPAIAPFDAEQAKIYQAAWAKHLGVPVEYTNSIGMKFVLIPPGEFLMGSTPQEIETASIVAGADPLWKAHLRSEGPTRPVTVDTPFYLGVHEVTQAQFAQMTNANPSLFVAAANNSYSVRVAGIDTSDFPVEALTWHDATAFCRSLHEKEQLSPLLAYSLPTETQWELACRAGTTTKFWTGDQDESLLPVAWFKTNSEDRPHPVGGLRSNPFGLFDMHGNVWEWIADEWVPPADSAATIPAGQRVLRGGDWSTHPNSCRSSHRHADQPTAKYGSVGFRVVLSVDAVRHK